MKTEAAAAYLFKMAVKGYTYQRGTLIHGIDKTRIENPALKGTVDEASGEIAKLLFFSRLPLDEFPDGQREIVERLRSGRGTPDDVGLSTVYVAVMARKLGIFGADVEVILKNRPLQFVRGSETVQ